MEMSRKHLAPRLEQLGWQSVSLLGYFLSAALTIHLTSDGRNHATVWPADAITLAILLRSPHHRWNGILVAGWIGNFLANAVTRDWAPGIIIYGLINMAQVWMAATLLRRWSPDDDLLANRQSTIRFLLITGVLAPASGAMIGPLVTRFNYGGAFGNSFILWYGSNALGFLIATPFFKAVFDGSYLRYFKLKSAQQRFTTLAFLTMHAVLMAIVFAQSSLPLLFLPLSSLMILAFCLGRLGVKAGIIILAIIGAVAAYQGVGPMALIRHDAAFRSLFFQAYLAIVLCTALPVAAILSSLAEAMKGLTEHKQTLRQVLAHSPDSVLSFDADGICRLADGRLKDHLGLDPADLIGKSAAEIAAITSDGLANLVHISPYPADLSPITEFEPLQRPGTTIEASASMLGSSDQPSGIVVTLRDITIRKSRETAIKKLAETDDLTGVLNRKGFRSRLARLVERAKAPISLALIDVDYFKAINDRYGHSIGDAVLAEVAARLVAGTRNTDFVGRLGGDEFAIVFHCDVATAQAACERIADTLRRKAVASKDNTLVMATISCGVAEVHAGMTREQAFDAADVALYEVKRSGRNGIVSHGVV